MTTRSRVVEVREPGRVALRLVISDRLPIGRDGDGLLLNDDRLSRRHCELRMDDGRLSLLDAGSSNGSFVNGARVTEPVVLSAGDVVRVGDTTIVIDPDLVPDEDVTKTATGDHPTATDESGTARAGDADTDFVAELRASIVGGTITILFSDIVDSTVLVERLGDREWLNTLGRHDELMREQLARYSGSEVKHQGDGFMLTFPSARHAVLFAISAQREFERLRGSEPGFPVHVRIGIHTGEVIHVDGDLFGKHVNVAARVAAQGASDEIAVSRLVHDLVSSMGDIGFHEPREVVFKGLEAPETIHPVVWQ